MKALNYKCVGRDAVGPSLRQMAAREFSALHQGAYSKPMDKGWYRFFYCERTVARERSLRPAHVFIALGKDVEAKLEDATRFLDRSGLDYPFFIQGGKACYTGFGAYHPRGESFDPARHNPLMGAEFHFALFNGSSTILEPLALEADGVGLSKSALHAFRRALFALMRRDDGHEEHIARMLHLIREDLEARGISPLFTCAGERMALPAPGDMEGAMALAGRIRERGLVGKEFQEMPLPERGMMAQFDFHGHPGSIHSIDPVPPSSLDIDLSSMVSCAPYGSRAEMNVQALALREGDGSFRLFLRPFLRNEEVIEAVRTLKAVRLGYLHELHNSAPGAPMGEEAPMLLRSMARMVEGSLEEDEGFNAALDQLESRLPEGNGVCLGLWNKAMESLEGRLPFPLGQWRERLWASSGGAFEEGDLDEA